MRSSLSMSILSLLLLLLSACMPMPLYNEVKGDLVDTRTQRDDAQRQLDDLRAAQADTL